MNYRPIIFYTLSTLLAPFAGLASAGTVHEHTITATSLENTALGTNPYRKIYVYTPDNYESSQTKYPVIYHVTSIRQTLGKDAAQTLDDAILSGELPPTLFVTADFSMEHGLNFFGNNEVVGHWLDFIHQDLRNWVEAHYRTTNKSSHRAISGHFLGGYAALKLAMFYPETYGSVYALHPVATESGDLPMILRPDWKEIHSAIHYSDLKAGASGPYVAMAQAHLPNPNRPPFFADFIVEMHNGQLKVDIEHMRKLKQQFHLGDLIAEHAENLQQLQGIAFDWGRNDLNVDHVVGARRYSILLENFGIEHSAEEHSGNGWDYTFSPEGKIRTRMLPFFGRHLAK